MPVSVVVGGQFGSEGKGKSALEIVRGDRTAAAAVRVGGTNSGHTVIGNDGQTYALRQLPAAFADRSVRVILPAGSYIDVGIFMEELRRLELGPDQVAVSSMARIITEEHKSWERDADLGRTIGSTQSGTGAAVMAMTARGAAKVPLQSLQAEEVPELQEYLKDTGSEIRRLLDAGKRVVVEGTQGFGLSLLQGGFWPKATSRDTTAAAFLAEAGLSPLDVDDVTLSFAAIRFAWQATRGCCPARPPGNILPLRPGLRRTFGS
jgi:adenylosuccinate synthase